MNISMTSTDVGQFFCMGYFLHLHNAILEQRCSFWELKAQRILAYQFSFEGSIHFRLLILSCPLNSKPLICHVK